MEIHFQPSWMYNPSTEYVLKQFFKSEGPTQFLLFDDKCGYAHPNDYFNLVYNLIHINRHIFGEGIGFRQIVDYYYILKASNQKERNKAIQQLKQLKLYKFTSLLMYVMKECLAIDDNFLLCPPNIKHGKRLLDDIMKGGNFGKYGQYAESINKQRINRACDSIKRNFRFILVYPEEVLWIPYFKLWHWCWRKWKGYL